MNKLLIIVFALLFFGGCDEIPPDVSNPNLGGGGEIDTTVQNQKRNVFVEEFTGFRCVNCPEGSKRIANFIDTYGERLVAVSIHAGFFSNPYPENNFDFRTEDGDQLLQLLGPEGGYPAATINRTKFENDAFLLDKDSWAGYISQDLETDPLVKIEMKKEYNSGNRTLDLDLKFHIQEDLDNELRYSIIITESGLVDAQLTPDSSPDLDLNYVHNHVFRQIIPQYDGKKIEEEALSGKILDVTESITLNSDWNAEKCEVIVIAHRFGDSIEILQVVEKSITE